MTFKKQDKIETATPNHGLQVGNTLQGILNYQEVSKQQSLNRLKNEPCLPNYSSNHSFYLNLQRCTQNLWILFVILFTFSLHPSVSCDNYNGLELLYFNTGYLNPYDMVTKWNELFLRTPLHISLNDYNVYTVKKDRKVDTKNCIHDFILINHFDSELFKGFIEKLPYEDKFIIFYVYNDYDQWSILNSKVDFPSEFKPMEATLEFLSSFSNNHILENNISKFLQINENIEISVFNYKKMEYSLQFKILQQPGKFTEFCFDDQHHFDDKTLNISFIYELNGKFRDFQHLYDVFLYLYL